MSDSKGPVTFWALPVHRSLIRPIYWMGVPRVVLVLEFLFIVLGGIIFKTFLVIPLIIMIHLVFQFMGERDSLFMDVLLRALRHNGYYGG